MTIAKPVFSTADQALHTEVRDSILGAKQYKAKRESNADFRQQYLPEHDLQILKALKDHKLGERFGRADTEDQKAICEELCDILKKLGQPRTRDSLYYRLRKLCKASTLQQINYRNTAKKKVEAAS